MAERRMFAKTIIDSDAFLDMPQSSQLLYFHLSMRADDDGFLNNPKSIMRNVGCKDDDINLLILKKFLIPFASGVVVIKHWKIHNYIRNDRYKETKYKEEKNTLCLDENNAYTQSNNMLGIPNDNQMDTQDRLGKVRLGKVKDKESKSSSFDSLLSEIADDELRNLYYEYIAMRKAIKSPITTERALKMLINKVDELEPNDISRKKKLLENAIVGNWKSVYPLKEEPKKETQTASYNLDTYTESQMNTPIVYRGKKK